MTPLETLIVDEIMTHGPMRFERFMEMCLRHPEHGYYMRRDPFGAKGDFVTAPEISQLFGEMIALWCIDVWMNMDSPPHVTLLECGPGRGTLMDDVLRSIKVAPAFREAAQPMLLEKSPHLREVQATKLGSAVTWMDELAALPAQPLIMFCNELFDSFAVARFTKTKEGWAEQAVGCEKYALSFTLLPVDPAKQKGFVHPAFAAAPEGAIAEISGDSIRWVEELAATLSRNGGAALIIDYGYEGPQPIDSLQAIYAKDHSAPLHAPGDSDLSAFVDFEPFRRVAENAGLNVLPVRMQRDFLIHCGILPRAQMLKSRATPEKQGKIDLDVTRLTSATRMGMAFKVFCMTQKDLAPPIGF
jgi:NADH dehydrogenase [ubiquinone] 1 alpha subcomplex assembly factor 7